MSLIALFSVCGSAAVRIAGLKMNACDGRSAKQVAADTRPDPSETLSSAKESKVKRLASIA